MWQNPRTTTTLYPTTTPYPPAPLTMQAGMYGHTRHWVYSPSWQMVCKKHECYPLVAAVLLQTPNLPPEWNKTSQFTLALWKENERTNILLLNGTSSASSLFHLAAMFGVSTHVSQGWLVYWSIVRSGDLGLFAWCWLWSLKRVGGIMVRWQTAWALNPLDGIS